MKKINEKEVDSNTQKKIKELQKEIKNYKEIQVKYRQQCEELTKRTIKIWTTIFESERQLKEEKYFK